MATVVVPSFFTSLAILLAGFAGGVPLAVPPLEEVPLLAKVAPEECLFYMSSAGMATPNARSDNQTEQLLAEPEVQTMAAAIEKAVKTALSASMKEQNIPESLSAEDIIDLAKALLTRPLAIYVSSAELDPAGPSVRGGAVVCVGDNVAKLKETLDAIVALSPNPEIESIEIVGERWRSVQPVPGLPIVWGFKGKYFVVGVGEGEVEALLERAKSAAPAWLTQLRQDLPIERLSTVAYVNVKAILELATPMAPPEAAKAIGAFGLDNVAAIRAVTGLDKKGFVSRTQVTLDGEPQGIFRLLEGESLASADVAMIPADATIAIAFKLDPAAVFDIVHDAIGEISPQAEEAMNQGIGQVEAILGLKLREGILASLGDTWRVYDLPDEGGLSTSTMGVVSLKDPKQAAAIEAKLLELAKVMQSRGASTEDESASSVPRIDKMEFAGKEIHTVSFAAPVPFTPAWCIAGNELIVAISPQAIKTHLSRPAEFKSLAESPDVAAAFAEDAGTLALSCYNSQRIFDMAYPMLNMWAQMASGARGQDFDLNAGILPSAGSIRKHLIPAVSMVRRTSAGIEVTRQTTFPGIDLMPSAPVMAALLLPGVQAGRQAARRASSMNNMKQIDLAILNYESVHRALPPAYKADASGKPLLSWRVLVLPYLEEHVLFEQFHLDEPWDSEHNKQLINKTPEVFKCPESTVGPQGKTNYLTVRGANTAFPGGKGVQLMDITDGTSATISLVEVSDQQAVIWTKPDDFVYDEKDPMKGLVGLRPAGFLVAFLDGTVHTLPSSLDSETLKALFIRNDGKAVNLEQFSR